ncbi:MAG: hypothetical protein IT385_20605 [Deltaproteobacteria bacterium]|nr:hypothetical protein [Deltaproteobacteria bacterium]
MRSLVVLTSTLAACSAFHWAEDLPPQGTARALGQYSVHLYGDLSRGRGPVLEDALGEALAILSDPQLQASLDQIAALDSGRCELALRAVDSRGLAARVLSAAAKAEPSISAWPNGYELLAGTSTIATTRRTPSAAISIDPERVDMWHGDIDRRACLIDTLVHEMTHLVDEPDGSTSFVDGRVTGREHMVSYRLGRLAACHFRARNGRVNPASCVDASLEPLSCPFVRR